MKIKISNIKLDFDPDEIEYTIKDAIRIEIIGTVKRAIADDGRFRGLLATALREALDEIAVRHNRDGTKLPLPEWVEKYLK